MPPLYEPSPFCLKTPERLGVTQLKEYIKENGFTDARAKYFKGRCAVLCIVLLLKYITREKMRQFVVLKCIMPARLQKSGI